MATSFLEKNLENEILLEEAIQIAIKRGEFEKAINYAHKKTPLFLVRSYFFVCVLLIGHMPRARVSLFF